VKSTYKDDILYDGSVPVGPNLPCQKSALRKNQWRSGLLCTVSLFVNERPNISQETHSFDSRFGIFLTCIKVLNLSSSGVVARYPAPDPALFASGFQDANKK
jgi:hypothetical protein